jgi:predicted DNA binding CopG/RHH family protein
MNRTNRNLRKIPRHRSENQERRFWSQHDSSDYIDWSRARPLVLEKLRPTLQTISIRLPEHLLAELKLLANKRDVPYQSLLKIFVAERVAKEIRKTARQR